MNQRQEPCASERRSPRRGRWKIAFGASLVLYVLLAPEQAHATDWMMLHGTEVTAREEEPIRPVFFVQPLYQVVLFPDEVTGLQSPALRPYEGRHAAFNVLSGDDTQSSFSVRRLRLGIRGTLPKTEGAVTYLATVDAGQNASTVDGPVVMDASVTYSSPWGPRFRAGQFKLATMDETLEAFHITTDTIDFSIVAARLLQERAIEQGTQTGAAYSFRDIGVMLFDTVALGKLRLSYAATLTNGRARAIDEDDAKDVGGRLQLAWLPKPQQEFKPDRDELALFGWGLFGSRHYAERERVDRLRAGGGAQLQLGWLRLRSELVFAKGALPTGAAPPFPGNPVAVAPDAKAWGATFLFGARVFEPLELDLALNRLDQQYDETAPRRIFTEAVFGAQYFIDAKAKLAINYAWRDISAPDASADGKRIVDTVAPKLSVQATVRY
ncbi:MAG: hypothetical protein R3B89_10120 [Polyangiaceae bacterium]